MFSLYFEAVAPADPVAIQPTVPPRISPQLHHTCTLFVARFLFYVRVEIEVPCGDWDFVTPTE